MGIKKWEMTVFGTQNAYLVNQALACEWVMLGRFHSREARSSLAGVSRYSQLSDHPSGAGIL